MSVSPCRAAVRSLLSIVSGHARGERLRADGDHRYGTWPAEVAGAGEELTFFFLNVMFDHLFQEDEFGHPYRAVERESLDLFEEFADQAVLMQGLQNDVL